MSVELPDLFSPDYRTARERFLSAAAARAGTEALELAARGPRGEPLAIDIAWLGAADAARLVLHTSGLHGVEAYAGSAVQLAALAQMPPPPAGCALVLVHVLNPWGMAWSRRTNENNVDLNRNFLAPGDAWSGAAPLYGALDRLLNPASPPGFDWFPLRIAGLALRYGYRAVAQAIAEGQYDHPRGLFYGGAELQGEPHLYLDWLRNRCGRVRYAFSLDVHTGLGPWGEQTLILEPGVRASSVPELAQAMGDRLIDPARGEASYVIRGSMSGGLARALPAARIDFVLQELGTFPAFRVLRTLREENRWHHYGRATLDHPVKAALREALSPASPAWRRRVIGHGVNLLRAACAWTFNTNTHTVEARRR